MMQNVSLADVIQLFLDVAMAGHHHSVPARVVTYDVAKQVATLEPMTKTVSRNADDERIVDALPQISDVPVQWMRGGGYFMTMPLVAGDGGMLLFTDTDIGTWRSSGQVSDPGDERRHALGGAVFQPGLETIARALVGVSGAHLVIGKEGGPEIHIDGSAVQLGATGGQPVALATSLLTWINSTLRPALASAPGGPIVVAAPTGVAATLVKAT